MSQAQTPHRRRFRKGAVRAASLMERSIRTVGESRGFAVSRLLTCWPEVAGEAIAKICQPVEVSFGRGPLGATLTVLTTGAQAPMLEMQKEQLRERVNACYGYQAIRRIHITQTAPTGFGETAAGYTPPERTLDPAVIKAARETATDVGDADLRAALERLGTNVLSKKKDRP
ncbi:hypothetical protein PARPLA_00402 [Rhodobacteraceae bacterium THAF1]|uniref:DUF721 domain-containing protein n=1 Tax=Palleronia sp. THAF1 TaxID=2587842 RepID=UPI000F419FD1|nr:DUF721 domain-containing protein [Palleronia sp. THAF1]QFU10035.1 hypothetical protein FIU81_15250 [Palleronia sp. THAF1]VDC17060.1 hypothetical protein PARPLA_00402 [Rhodobacteraceae bacterium THAF1]